MKTETIVTESNVTEALKAADKAIARKVAKAKKPAAKKAKGKAKAKAAAKGKGKPAAKAKPAARANSKQADFIAAMRTPKGISIEEAAKRFGWQAHTVRGAVAGALKKKLGLKVDAERDEERGTVYRIK